MISAYSFTEVRGQPTDGNVSSLSLGAGGGGGGGGGGSGVQRWSVQIS